MQITYSNEKINGFGGINLTDHILNKGGIYEFIDRELGSRHSKARYSYSDIVRSYLNLIFSGGDCAEDINDHNRPILEQLKGFNPPSADTLLRMQKELSTEKQLYTGHKGIDHEFNSNIALNRLMVRLLINLRQVISSDGNTLDYDNQFTANDKYDSRRSYKKADGYMPGIASIGNYPVYIENRNGNSNVKYRQAETLERMFNLLKEFDIRIKRFRADCGSFTREVISLVEKETEYFYIRAMRCSELLSRIKNIVHWQEVEIGYKTYQVASIEYAPFGGEKSYRYVISREKKNDGQYDLFSGDNFVYRAIMTNDWEKTDEEIIRFYNARGESERLFDEMNNDFCWKKMPFSFLQENTVFMIIMAICRNLYHFLINFISKKVDFVKSYYRLKKFIYRFIVVPVKWIRRGRQEILKLFSSRGYHLVLE